MGLLDNFTKRDSAGATPAASAANVITGEQSEQARVRAKRRLIGAVVLLGVGVIAFPLLFETQPRPIPVDIPIVIPPRDGAPPLALPAPKPAAKPVAASAPTTVAQASQVAAPAPETPPAAKPSEPAPAKPAVAAAPPPKPEPAKPAAEAPKPVAPSAGRFVVQIGAFSEASAVRDVRSKAEKAGLATFTQTVDTSDGRRTRVRIGPFASREEAEKAAAQAKAAGLSASVLTL